MTNRKSSRRSKGGPQQTTPRHLWLAALGAVAVARRETLAGAEAAFDAAVRLRDEAGSFARDARDVARGAAMTMGEKVEPVLSRIGNEIETRVAPLLGRFGIQRPARRAARTSRKTAVRKTPARRNGRGRSQAAQRMARKGRA